MDSTEDLSPSYEKHIDCSDPKPTLVDASVQLDLIEECSPENEVETIETFPNVLSDLEMKLPITIQNCLPVNAMQVSSDLFVIANNGLNFLNEQKIPLTPVQTIDASEPLRKRICIEQNGQTYILAIQDSLDGLASIVELRDKGSTALGTPLLGSHESISNKQGINQNWFTTRADKTSLQNDGHVWKQGMWSKEEIELLESNIQQYCEEHDISTPATVIFDMSKDERKDFYRTVAKGLNRPLFSVYRRVIRMYDNKNHVGKYTPEELSKLRELRSIYGNDWQTIGSVMGRSASSIKDRCRLMRDNCNQGKWLPSEEKQLADTVYELTNCLPGEMISSGLSWAIVAEKVKTRSEKQCRTKWLNYLNWKEAGGTEWTKDDDMALICRVCATNASDETHVDWTELAKGWLSVRSPQWLRGKWWSLKRHVPNGNSANFPEVCECLYQHFVLKVQCTEPCPSPTDKTLSITPGPIITHIKPAILQSVLPAPAPNGIVMTNVVTQACQAPIVSLASSNSIALENGFSSVRVTPLLQTLEVLPANTQTFLTSPHSQQAIPITTAIPPSQIIIHTVPAEPVQTNDSITVHLDQPTQLVLSSENPMTSLASTQIPSAPPSPEIGKHIELDNSTQALIDSEQYETQVIEVSTDVLDEDGQVVLCTENPVSHIILSDPMLASGARAGGINPNEMNKSSHEGIVQETVQA